MSFSAYHATPNPQPPFRERAAKKLSRLLLLLLTFAETCALVKVRQRSSIHSYRLPHHPPLRSGFFLEARRAGGGRGDNIT